MINIGIIEPVGSNGGNDIYCYNLSKSISKNPNVKLILYGPDKFDSRDNFLSKDFFKNVFNSKNALFKTLKYSIGIFKSLIHSKKNNINIIHFHYFGFSVLDYLNLLFFKYILRVRIVCTVHDIESFATFDKEEKIINFSWWRKIDFFKKIHLISGIVVHSDYAKSLILNKCIDKKIKSPIIHKIHASDIDYSNLNSTDFVNKSESRQKLNLPLNKKIILFFGQIKKVKNLSLLIKSMKNIKNKRNDVVLLVAGKIWKDDIHFYENLIKINNLEDIIIFRSKFISNKSLPHYFNSSDIVALPYKQIYNSGVLIRSLSYSKAIVASDIPVFKEFIDSGDNGFLFQNNDEKSLTEQLLKVLDLDDNKLKKVTKLAHDSIVLKLDIDKISKLYYNFYKEVLI